MPRKWLVRMATPLIVYSATHDSISMIERQLSESKARSNTVDNALSDLKFLSRRPLAVSPRQCEVRCDPLDVTVHIIIVFVLIVLSV